MSILEQIRDKYKSHDEGTDKTDKRINETFNFPGASADKTDKSPSVSSVSPHDRHFEGSSAANVIVDLDREKARRNIEIRDSEREERRQSGLRKLAMVPESNRYVWETYRDIDPEHVVLVVAIRGQGTCELSIPRKHYDGFRLLEILQDREPAD
jgi:hypothetical protein